MSARYVLPGENRETVLCDATVRATQWAWHTATFTSIFIALVMLYAMLDYARRRRLLFVPESKM